MVDVNTQEDILNSIYPEKHDIFEKALEVLQIPTKDRTPEQIRLLVSATENFQFFLDMNAKKRARETDAHKRCCKRFKYETMPPGTTVFKLGEFSDKFFIVIRGSVNVLIQKDPEKLRNEIAEYKEKYAKLYERALDISEYEGNRVKLILDEYSKIDQERIVHLLNKEVNYFGITGGIEPKQIDDIKHYFKDGVFVYNCVGNIGKGRIFGELGLIMKKSRATTIMVKERAHFGVLTKEDYEEILMNLEAERVYRKNLTFKKYLPSQMGAETVTKFAYLFEKMKFKMNQTIFVNGDPANQVFFIKLGEVLLYKMMDPSEDEASKKEGKSKPKAVVDRTELLNVHSQKKTKLIMLPIQQLGTGQFFGEEEILQNKRTRIYGAVCVSAKGTLYAASKDNFLTVVNQRHDLNEFFKRLANLRSAWHEDHQNYLKNATNITQSIIQGLNKINIKSHRITAGAIDREYEMLKEHEQRESLENSPIIRVQARTAEPRNSRAVNALRGSLPNSSSRSPRSPDHKNRKSLDDSAADSIANFDRQVELNKNQVEKVLASSKAVGYTTLIGLDQKQNRSLTLAEAYAKKLAAQQKDPNRHHKSAWKGVDLYQNIQDSAKKSVLEYLTTKLDSLGEHTKIHRLEPRKTMTSSKSQRSFGRTSSNQRPTTKRSATERSLSSTSQLNSRPGTSAGASHPFQGLTNEHFFNLAVATPRSHETSNKESQFSPRRSQNGFHEKKNNLEAIEEKDITAKIEALVFQPQVGCYVNAEFPKLIPKLKSRTKSMSDDKRFKPTDTAKTSFQDNDDKRIKSTDTARNSFQDLIKQDRFHESEGHISNRISDSVLDYVSTSHRPFYSSANVFNVNKMKKLRVAIHSLKTSR